MKKHSPHFNPQQVTKLLTRSSEQLDSQILSSLSQARTIALQKQRQHASAFSLSAVGHRAYNLMPHSTHQWVATTILFAAVLFGAFSYWQSSQVPLDIEILTDDLPIEVFVDQSE